jgi:hypothetical protein
MEGFDDKILTRYARRLSTRDIQGQLEELYGVEVSPAPISNVTDAVMEDERAWKSRPLSAVYLILYFGCALCQNPARRAGNDQGSLSGAGHQPGGRERTAWFVGGPDGAFHAWQICEKCSFTKETLRRKLYELSIQRGQLINVPGLSGKSASLVLTGKLLESHGYKQCQRFKHEFAEKQITPNMI